MADLKSLKNGLDLGEYGEDYIYDDYTGYTYIDDSFREFADSNTSIYYTQIINFIAEHVEEVNDTINEFGWDGCGGDLYKAGQMAEYEMIYRDLIDHADDICLALAYDYLMDNGYVELSDDEYDEIENSIDGSIERYDAITDICDNVMSMHEESGEEDYD